VNTLCFYRPSSPVTNNQLLPTLILTTLAPLAVSVPAHALSLLGNLPLPNDGSSSVVESMGSQPAIGFTLPGGIDYTLDSVNLRLGSYNTVAGGDMALVQIFEDSARTSANPNEATLVPLTFTNPVSSSDAFGTFTFTPNAVFTFRANTRYWLLVDAAAGFYTLRKSFPETDYTSDAGVTFNDFVFSSNNGATYTSFPTIRPGLRINATPVPFEFHGGAGLTLLVAAGWLARCRSMAKQS